MDIFELSKEILPGRTEAGGKYCMSGTMKYGVTGTGIRILEKNEEKMRDRGK